MNRKRIWKSFLPIIFLIFIIQADSANLPFPIGKKAFEAIRSIYKVYTFCAECGDKTAKLLIVNEKGVEPVSDGVGGYDYKFFVNKKTYVNILHLYFQSEGKWINLGLYSGLVNPEIEYELDVSKYPFDIERESEKEFITKSDLDPLTIFENKILKEINFVRTNPVEYSKKLKERIPYFDGNIYRPLDRSSRNSIEGVKGIERLIFTLENAEPLSPLSFSPEISIAIKENFKRKISYSSRWRELKERYAKSIQDAELVNIMEGDFFGYNISEDLIAYILVSQSNRKFEFKDSIFDKEMKYIGIGCQTNSQYGYGCHLLLSSGIAPEENIQSFQNERNTVSSISYLSEFEKKVIDETNLLRTKPKEYSEILKERRKYFKGKFYKEPFRAPVNLVEGVAALEEAINFLEKVEPISALAYSEELTISSKDHVLDTGPKGIIGHYGSNGSSPQTRILSRKKDAKLLGENIDYGWVDPREVVISLLVDDGVSDRGHRKNLFHTGFKYIGVSCGFHRDFPIICVQNFGAW